MKQFNRTTGQLGENIAVTYLQNKGYRIIERNFKTNFGELDIIAENKGFLIFVEVKYRTSLYFGEPYEAVNTRKLHKLRQLVDFYYVTRKPFLSPKIEILSIAKLEKEIHIKHIQTIIF